MSDIDYVKRYATELKDNPELFGQQRMLITSQMTSSTSFFLNVFGKKHFNEHARAYLKKTGLL